MDGEFHEALAAAGPARSTTGSAAATSFASGLIYGLMNGKTPEQAVNYGAAHGALAMTTPGDTTMATLKEVEKVMKGGGARVARAEHRQRESGRAAQGRPFFIPEDQQRSLSTKGTKGHQEKTLREP